MIFEQSIALAEKLLEEGDLHGAIFVLRDLQETEKAGLTDMAWEYCKGNVARNEVRHFIDSVKAGKWLTFKDEEELRKLKKETKALGLNFRTKD